jgi:hypothetical protein
MAMREGAVMIDKRRWMGLTASIILWIAAPAAEASPHVKAREGDETRIANCIQRAAGGKAWLEKTLWGLRDQEGGWIGAEVANTDGSHDLGPLQINSWWVSRLSALTGRPADRVRWWLANDACFNVEAARWIFLSGLAVTGNYWKAVGVYHSPTAWRQRRYTESVIRHLRHRFGHALFIDRRVSAYPSNKNRGEQSTGFGVQQGRRSR